MDVSDLRRKECDTPSTLETDPPGLGIALLNGCKLHVFMSGGGLRVASLTVGDKQKGYGEHPYLETALSHVGEDYLAGGRPYKEVYGGIYDHYLTGSSSPSTDLDAQIRRGRNLDAWRGDDGSIICEINGSADTPTPKGLRDAVMKDGQPREFKHRGFVYKISPSRFPNGEACVSIAIVGGRKPKNGAEGWFYPIVKTGKGSTFAEASQAALEDGGREDAVSSSVSYALITGSTPDAATMEES